MEPSCDETTSFAPPRARAFSAVIWHYEDAGDAGASQRHHHLPLHRHRRLDAAGEAARPLVTRGLRFESGRGSAKAAEVGDAASDVQE